MMQPILYYGKDPYLARSMGSRANSCGQTYPNDANEQAHPCAKPIAMMQWLVGWASLEGMTVCDPFMNQTHYIALLPPQGRYSRKLEPNAKLLFAAPLG